MNVLYSDKVSKWATSYQTPGFCQPDCVLIIGRHILREHQVWSILLAKFLISEAALKSVTSVRPTASCDGATSLHHGSFS